MNRVVHRLRAGAPAGGALGGSLALHLLVLTILVALATTQGRPGSADTTTAGGGNGVTAGLQVLPVSLVQDGSRASTPTERAAPSQNPVAASAAPAADPEPAVDETAPLVTQPVLEQVSSSSTSPTGLDGSGRRTSDASGQASGPDREPSSSALASSAGDGSGSGSTGGGTGSSGNDASGPGGINEAADLIPPSPVHLAVPVLPRRAGFEEYRGSTVELLIQVGATGDVAAVRLVQGSGSATVDSAAVGAIRRSTFTPGSEKGAVIPMWTTVEVSF